MERLPNRPALGLALVSLLAIACSGGHTTTGSLKASPGGASSFAGDFASGDGPNNNGGMGGATVVAVCSAGKAPEVKEHGADWTLERRTDLVAALGAGSVDVVIDLVGGPHWPQLLDVLRRGGRYAIAGAIGGPIAEIDLRTVYLKDLTLYGCTFQTDDVFENLVTYIERGEIRPVVSGAYPLSDIARAQEDFLAKKHTGKLVLIPPATAK